MDYTKMTIKELIAFCKEKGINGYSGKKKADLIEIIQSKTVATHPTMAAEHRVIRNVETVSPPMEKTERIKRLKEHLALSKIKHEEEVMKLSTLKEAHVYCVIHGLSAQQYGPLLEKYIRTTFNYIKNKAEDCIGDCSKDGQNLEVKVSLGGALHSKFNFVQIRPSHDCDTYILTAYHLSCENVETEGELFVFKVPKEDIKQIVVSYGGYAHGTIREHGRITAESLNDEKSMKEYALRPSVNDECWKALMQYRVIEADL